MPSVLLRERSVVIRMIDVMDVPLCLMVDIEHEVLVTVVVIFFVVQVW